MTQQTRRLLLILLFFLVLIGFVVLVWLLFFKPIITIGPAANRNTNGAGGALPNTNVNRPVNTNGRQPVAQGPGTLPTPAVVANGDLTLVEQVTTQRAPSLILASDGGNLQYYDESTDRFLRLDPATGRVTELSNQKFPDVQKVTWSPDGRRAVLEFPDDVNVVYDFAGQRQYTVPKEAEDFSFSSDSSSIAYKFPSSEAGENVLVTAAVTGSQARVVADLGRNANRVQVAWSPTNEVVALYRTGLDSESQEVVLVGQNDENFKTIRTNGQGFNGKWTPDGTKLLYTVYSSATNWRPELSLVNARGDAIGLGNTSLGLFTFVDRCTFSPDGGTAYCAVPDALDEGSGPYPEFGKETRDALYAINLSDATTRLVAQPVSSRYERYTMENLVVSSDGSTLYFTDASAGVVRKLRLR